ncbi:formimidoylglutamate deiminase [Gryllotalpicola reticulitermitis]|uniref:Formimidoylglutamate deiminase n=1 Tax=Gryllotalpicola reticulitermitis TaxID=1184153 RepID=A0ABV8Q901_9MICO
MSAAGAFRSIHARRALVMGAELSDVLIDIDAEGRIARITPDASAPDDALRLGTVLAGSGNAHSHAFHRALRGRTHDQGGDFWVWRREMYRVAAALDPESYFALAEATFAEMVAAGWTAVAEFHYVHHRPDGTPYDDPNAIGAALIAAARSAGIRLTLLDTCYLAGGIDKPLEPAQRRFGDGTVDAWLERWHALAELGGDTVTIGAAMHSVRALAPEDIARVAALLPAEVPLHIHLSEQQAENEHALARYGRTPTQLLAEAGALTPRLSVVHATHLVADDVRRLGDAGVTAVFCPTTEADLGDGIGPARALADAGATLALGSDQNAVIDPFLEVRALEGGERLRTHARGRFTPAQLDAARSTGGYRALGLAGGLAVGGLADLIEVDSESARTAGSELAQLALAATAADVTTVVVGGRVVARNGHLADDRRPAELLDQSLRRLAR